nr:uncharacterized protein LOC131750058 isoform X1 [Kogia breviceps]
MPPPAPPTELVPSERAVVLLSCALSALGSGLLVATHALWPDLRSRARRLLLFLSLADLLSAASYFYGVLQDFEGPSWDCVLQGALSTFANTSSFFWTVAIALYLYLSIVRTSRGPGDGRLLWAFHVVSWGVPLVITVAAVTLKKIGYDASDVSVGWCWIDLEAEDRVLWMLLTGKAWEMLAYVTLPVLYLLIRKHINRARLTPVLALATLIAAFGSSFQYGYNVAVINSPAKPMKAFYNETYYDRISEYISEFSLTLLWSLSVSMFPFGGFLGSLMVGPLVNKLGRKGTLLFNNVFSIVPAILMGCSEVARSFEMIIVARLLVGICAGLSSNVVPMYLGELAPRNLRGALGVVPQLFITVGILAAQILGLRSLLANEAGWPTLLGVTGVPAALQLLLLPFFPESPRYLLIQKKDEAAAKNALRGLRGWDDVDAETQEIWEEDKAEKAAGFISVLKLLRMRSLRWQVISIVVLMGGQQLSGVNAVPGRPGPGAGRPPPRGPGRPAGLTSPGGGLPDLLLRRPDLPERWGESTGCPVCDGGHRRGQRADDRLRRFRGGAPGEESPAPPRLLHLLRRLLRADGRPGSAGHNILDALRQHRVHHLLCHRTCPWAQPYPRTAHHRDRPAVLPAGRLHGRGQCPLALQLHCGLDLPIHPSGPRSLQLYRFCRDMSSHHHLHLPGCPRDQVQDLHRNQSDLHQDEQSVRAAPRKGGAKGLSALYCGAVTLEEEPVNQVDPSPAPRHMPGSCPSTVLGQPLCGSWQHRLL